eukprot:1391410-Pyramimonas_sp.AAC.1
MGATTWTYISWRGSVCSGTMHACIRCCCNPLARCYAAAAMDFFENVAPHRNSAAGMGEVKVLSKQIMMSARADRRGRLDAAVGKD